MAPKGALAIILLVSSLVLCLRPAGAARRVKARRAQAPEQQHLHPDQLSAASPAAKGSAPELTASVNNSGHLSGRSFLEGLQELVDKMVALKHPDPRAICTGEVAWRTGYLGCNGMCRCNWYERCQTKLLVQPGDEGETGGNDNATVITDVGVCGWDPEFLVFVFGGGFFTFSCVFLLCASFKKGEEGAARPRKPKAKKKKAPATSEAF